jgi:hypothetical protein
MERCTVSVLDSEAELHQVAVNAASLFDAVDQAIEQWSRLWWFDADSVAEVQAGNRSWRGAASARYFMARWNGHVGSVRIKLLKLMRPTTRCDRLCPGRGSAQFSIGLLAFTVL